MTKVIVFGGSGFLGSHVADKLSEYGNQVSIFDLRQSEFLRKDQQLIIGNILDKGKVEEAISDQDVVYNFAGYADLDTASANPTETAMLNVIGNINILEACIKSGLKQYIYASTIYVYSESGGFYRCSKQSSEIFIEEYQKRHGLNFTILRYGTLYGPRSDLRNSVHRYLKSAIENGEIRIKGTGSDIREYIHVRDAAKISAKIISPEYYNKRFVITGHQAIPVSQLAEMIREILKKPVKIHFDASGESDHYKVTPYSFVPKIGEKFAPDIFTDMGQGLIECLVEISESDKN
ncbi:MAG: NAD(P)-dependent oxidoreductase [Leptospira sp.]|nr:NAD(P)-dependent oxidoreductase [Leptospira sp.]